MYNAHEPLFLDTFLQFCAPALFQGISNISITKMQNLSQLEKKMGHKGKLEILNI